MRRDASRPAVDERVLLGVTFRDEPLVEETRVSSGWLARLDPAQHNGQRGGPGDGARQTHAERWASAVRLDRIEPAAQRGARHRRSGSRCRFQAARRAGRAGRDRGNRRRQVARTTLRMTAPGAGKRALTLRAIGAWSMISEPPIFRAEPQVRIHLPPPVSLVRTGPGQPAATTIDRAWTCRDVASPRHEGERLPRILSPRGPVATITRSER